MDVWNSRIEIYRDKANEWRWRLVGFHPDGTGVTFARSHNGHDKLYEAQKDARFVRDQLTKALRRPAWKV